MPFSTTRGPLFLFNTMFRWSQKSDGGGSRNEAVGQIGEGLAREGCRGFPLVLYIIWLTIFTATLFKWSLCFFNQFVVFSTWLVCLKRILERLRLGYTDRKLLVVFSCRGVEPREHHFTCIVYPKYSSRYIGKLASPCNKNIETIYLFKPKAISLF